MGPDFQKHLLCGHQSCAIGVPAQVSIPCAVLFGKGGLIPGPRPSKKRSHDLQMLFPNRTQLLTEML